MWSTLQVNTPQDMTKIITEARQNYAIMPNTVNFEDKNAMCTVFTSPDELHCGRIWDLKKSVLDPLLKGKSRIVVPLTDTAKVKEIMNALGVTLQEFMIKAVEQAIQRAQSAIEDFKTILAALRSRASAVV
ncbi:MAG: hypothetical protein DRO11_07830 [Methanobacteriota archaeon]|nr:MAG: hypothetical protein DRO11_07830 [Euryarchaeota archaeon]